MVRTNVSAIRSFIHRLGSASRNFAMRFFTPKEFRAVLFFLAVGFAVLCYREGRRLVAFYFPSVTDSVEVRSEHRNDSLFALLSQKDFIRDSLEFWAPSDSTEPNKKESTGVRRSRKEAQLKAHGIPLNSALPETLRLLPGIGESMAARIVAYRTERGGFRRLEELMNIPGVGEKTFSRIAPYLRLD